MGFWRVLLIGARKPKQDEEKGILLEEVHSESTRTHTQADNYSTRMGLLDPSTKAYKQRRGTYFYYNRAAIGLACAQATAMKIDIAPHKRPRKKLTHHVPDPHHFHIPPHAHLYD